MTEVTSAAADFWGKPLSVSALDLGHLFQISRQVAFDFTPEASFFVVV